MSDVVNLRLGKVKGRRNDDLIAFAGIRYARAPVGSLRFRPPVEPEKWDGIYEATEFGSFAPQAPPSLGSIFPYPEGGYSEDCLFLNVWTPGCDAARRPVMFWIHGGSFASGSGSLGPYRGGPLARAGDVVIVSCNYRLGALGFLAHPSLSTEGATGNWGLLDQLAALGWVRENISQFGGDPDNVTVFGESAGGMSVAALLAMPASKGLFRRAIIQSGPPCSVTADTAADTAVDLAAVLDCAPNRANFEAVPVDDLVAATLTLGNRTPVAGRLPLVFTPTVDGVSLPLDPISALNAGASAEVDLICGVNRDELSTFIFPDVLAGHMDYEHLERGLLLAAPDVDPAAAIEGYRRIRTGRGEEVDIRHLWTAIGSDMVFRWPSLQLTRAHARHNPKTYAYLFEWTSPLLDGALGSMHSLEIPFVFRRAGHDSLAGFTGTGPAVDALTEAMSGAWLAFARNGNPNAKGLARWRRYSPADEQIMVFGPTSRCVAQARLEEIAVLEQAQVPAGLAS